VFVIDEWHRRGLGTELARAVVQRACANGIGRLEATTLFENHAARALLKRLGFRARGSADGAIELALDLGSARPCAA
jgi:RimJ/RimL family protein N-acetyltransferase